MKRIALLITAITVTIGAMAQQVETRKNSEAQKAKAAPVKAQAVQTPSKDEPTPANVIKMSVEKHDFGKIKQGVPVFYSFEIKNISNKPVVVENSYASCGCTTPEKIVEPILPGATAKLKVQYTAANPGVFTKDVHIKLAGITQEKIVYITGEVIATATEAPKSNN
ncbi:MAG TPA: DUF1573 domain-containing protein [Chitinophagaceae bacterium]